MDSLFKARVVIILIFALLYSFVFFTTTQDKQERVQYILDQNIKDLDVNYRINDNYFKTISNNAFYQISTMPGVLELLYQAKHTQEPQELDRLRTKLYSKLKPLYTQLKKSGVIIILFSFEDNHTFLRIHKPSKFGDDLSKVRYSFTYVNKYKKEILELYDGH